MKRKNDRKKGQQQNGNQQNSSHQIKASQNVASQDIAAQNVASQDIAAQEIWRVTQRDFNFLFMYLVYAEDALESIESLLESVLSDVDWRGYQDTENACRESAELTEQALAYVRKSMKCYRRVSRHVANVLFRNRTEQGSESHGTQDATQQRQ